MKTLSYSPAFWCDWVISGRTVLRPAIARNPALDFCHQPSLCEPLKTPAPRLERDRRRDDAGGDGGGADAGKFAAQSSRLPKRHRSGFFHLGYILAGGLAYCANCLPGLGGFQPCLGFAEFCVRPDKGWNFHQLVPGKAEQALDQDELLEAPPRST